MIQVASVNSLRLDLVMSLGLGESNYAQATIAAARRLTAIHFQNI
jgi:hypothetical protein